MGNVAEAFNKMACEFGTGCMNCDGINRVSFSFRYKMKYSLNYPKLKIQLEHCRQPKSECPSIYQRMNEDVCCV